MVRFKDKKLKQIAHQCAFLWNGSYSSKYKNNTAAKQSRLYVVMRGISCEFDGKEFNLCALFPIAEDPTIHEDCSLELIELPEGLLGIIKKDTFIHPELCVVCTEDCLRIPIDDCEIAPDFNNLPDFRDQLEEAVQDLWLGTKDDLAKAWQDHSAKDFIEHKSG